MEDLTSSHVVGWLRLQATAYSEMAARIERDLACVASSITGQNKPQIPSPEIVRSVMKNRKMRLRQIADILGLPEGYVRPVVTPDNGFSIGDRGWITVKDAANAAN